MSPPRFACFAIALPLYRVFEYTIADKDPAVVGARYRLPFANGIKTGVLLNASDHSEFDPARIKPVQERLDEHSILGEHMLALARWMSDYYLQPLGEVVFQCIPVTCVVPARTIHCGSNVGAWRKPTRLL